MILRRVLKPGASFGEYALITSGARSATITALTKLHLAVLSKKDYDDSLGYFCAQKMDESLNVLRKQSMFSEWAKNTLMKASYFFVEKTYDRKQWVYQEEEAAELLFVVVEGEFKFFNKIL
jgi:CRP-like cAMP-binding protein